MDGLQEITYNREGIEHTVQWLLDRVRPNSVVCLHGSMGAGKTTLVNSLVKALGGTGGSSPTFGIVNEYADGQGSTLGYHFDFYRIKNEWEAMDLGFEDYLNQPVWIFIEWPEKVESLLPQDRYDVYLTIMEGNERKISILHNK